MADRNIEFDYFCSICGGECWTGDIPQNELSDPVVCDDCYEKKYPDIGPTFGRWDGQPPSE